ncbi:hypothetical protein ADH76_06110 [Enterocloster clostridioformis]|uniref:1-aminocyclopropane-1-carboxylate deaminase/D-cysteine desulfhydrase n=3 Tax=Enterocloster clostridioformis TaxID=1531 RepID=UPI0009C251B8|nr:pyridoxal-phosphate dependent enzyme [Enterocloster clostridioformis]ARE65186.1 hypothetical protein A4V08_37460 [Lachnoclostridium sp. YL32]NDO28487.1 pyridoxal-phosphate dependent enzyme [Enterocloster clostridioformis]OXE70917.1 hypothetical protein ADH76_06110 [Enterocloster clostridioformis]QQR01075.1 pyridoxal-phosphate dependent enzyme [Enterocloster clostridioformis]
MGKFAQIIFLNLLNKCHYARITMFYLLIGKIWGRGTIDISSKDDRGNGIGGIRKTELIKSPSPIHKLDAVSRDYGCSIYIKRDDLIGVGLGGNKVRKLEYLLADAMKSKCRLIVTSGSLQTNHGMLTALCATKLGLHCVLFLLIEESEYPRHLSGNLILDEFIGCDVEFVYVADIMENNDLTTEEKDRLSGERLAHCKKQRLASYLSKYGLTEADVYYINSAGSMPLGVLGYVDCMKEIKKQTNSSFDYIFCGNGSGGTFAGMWLGAYIYMPDTKVIAVNIEEMSRDKPGFIVDLIKSAAQLLERYVEVSVNNLEILSNSLGVGYAKPDDETMKIIEYVARKEGIFLDPVYTGKIFNGALNYIETSLKFSGKHILLLHSGGIPGIYNENMLLYKSKSSALLDRWNHDSN